LGQGPLNGCCVHKNKNKLVDEDEARLTNPSVPQQVKCVASKPVTLPVIEGTIKSVISELLNSLIIVDASQRSECK